MSRKRIFLCPNQNKDFPVFFENKQFVNRHRYCYKDVLRPVLSQQLEEIDNYDVQFIGNNNKVVGFVHQYGNDNVTNIYLYGCSIIRNRTCLQLKQIIPIQNIVGSRSFDNKILLPNWRNCLLFSENRLSLHISILMFGNNFQDAVLKNNVLKLDECQHNIQTRFCVSVENELLAVVQPYTSSVFSILTVDLVNIFPVEQQLSAKFLSRQKFSIPFQNKLLDCAFVYGGEKLILITDSPSKGNVFICCSVSPLLKLFSTKIQCNRESGWFLVSDANESPKFSTQLLTIKDLDHNDKLVELFSCGDERNFIPLNSFTLSSIGMNLVTANFISVSHNMLFIINVRYTVVFDINRFCVMYTLPLGQQLGNLQSVDVKYNGYEIFVHRKLVSGISDHDGESNDGTEEEGEEEEQYLESSFDIFVAPKPSISLYGLCREFVFKNFSDKEIQSLPLPSKLKKEFASIRFM
jgi:hypothetical protein